jgi:exopolysaccharide biosynthesis polyprenyl glycosylphosphotransferase
VECYARQPLCGVHVIGVFADVPGACEGFTPDGSIADLLDISARSRVDAIIIALPPGLGHEREIPGLVWRLRSVAADLFVAPYLMHGPNILLPIQAIGPLSFTVLQRRPLNDLQAIRKFVFDYVLCLALLIPFLVFFLLVVIAIKLDSPGPALFRQPRFGLNNRRFTIFKFRSMYADQADLVAARQTSRGDPRVTRVGKWLRRFSIDEMPQIFNVLRGEMSLVGPRPHAPQTRIEGELLDNVLVDYVMRYRVKPGITGLAQVNGARGQLLSSEDLRRRVRFDLEYIKRWSLALDIKIIALTVLREFVSKNAF